MSRTAKKQVLQAVDLFTRRYHELVDELIPVVIATGNVPAIHAATRLETGVNVDLRWLKNVLRDDESRVSRSVAQGLPAARSASREPSPTAAPTRRR